MSNAKPKRKRHAPPLDTMAGIAAAIHELRPTKQCKSCHYGRSGTITFCEKQEGHDGEHKGLGKRWSGG